MKNIHITNDAEKMLSILDDARQGKEISEEAKTFLLSNKLCCQFDDKDEVLCISTISSMVTKNPGTYPNYAISGGVQDDHQ